MIEKPNTQGFDVCDMVKVWNCMANYGFYQK